MKCHCTMSIIPLTFMEYFKYYYNPISLDEDEWSKFSITDAKSLLRRMEEKKAAEPSNDDQISPVKAAAMGDSAFKNKVKVVKTTNALGKVLSGIGEDRHKRLGKNQIKS